MTKKVIWNPPAELIENSKLTKFIKYCSVKNYDELEIKSKSDPGWLWENVIKFSDIKFFKNYKKIIDEANGAPWTKWCVGGKTNIVLNCIDRHKDKDFFKNQFIYSEKENGESSSITYEEFDKQISKVGNVAGCFVKEGLISRNSKIRILRDNVVIHTGTINSLKRFKEEVKEVKTGYECGVMIENYSDIKVNDIIETFEVVESKRKL